MQPLTLGDFFTRPVTDQLIFIGVGIGAFVLLWLTARLLRGVIERAMKARQVPPELAILTSRAGYLAIIVVAIFVGFSITLARSDVALTGVILATIVASLGVQDILKNYVSGVYIVIERNIRVGDHIEFGDRSGVVSELKIRVTYLRGRAGELIVVPNAELFNNTVVVRSARGGAPELPGEVPREHAADHPAPAPEPGSEQTANSA